MKKIIFKSILLISIIISGCNGCNNENKPQAKKYIRKSVYSKDAEKDLQALEKALKIMKTMDCSHPISWYYQGAIHWIPDTIIGKNNLCNSYQNKSQLKEAWDNCTHTESGAEEIHFLVWHRLYIYHFEKIVRKLSGYNDFALSYWGYTDTKDTVKSRTMPEIFRNSNLSLYEPGRLDSINNGYPISGKIVRRLSLTKLNSYHLYYLYNKNINSAPHGAMHNYLGFGNDTTGKLKDNKVWQQETYGLMSEVATAAFDPIFWVHHANIDRLWQQWTNSPNGQNVLLEELNSVDWPYVFYDENGKKVTYKIEDVAKDLYNTNYDYDDTKVMPNKINESKTKAFAPESLTFGDTIAKDEKITLLKSGTTILNIANKNTEKIEFFSPEKSEGKVLILNVTVSFTKAPKGDFELYLNPTNSEKLTPESNSFIGVMTFFGADHKHSNGHQMHNMPSDNRIRKTFSFEITNEVKNLNALSNSSFNISILKFDGSLTDEIQVEKVSIIKQ